MVKWLLKAGVQGVLSVLPQSQRLNYVMQRHVTGSFRHVRLKMFEMRLEWAAQHIGYWRTYGNGASLPATVLELGTGWFLTVPVALYLMGVNRIITVDINDLAHPQLMREMLAVFAALPLDDWRERLPAIQPDRLENLRQVAAQINQAAHDDDAVTVACAAFGIERIIGDAAQLALPSASVDFIISNTTLEHIPQPVLIAIFAHFKTLLAADGLMSHRTDMGDHYAHGDNSITHYNYLRYNDFVWGFFNNALQYQNRLRLPDYQRLHTDTGFNIVFEDISTKQAPHFNPEHIAPQFKHYTTEELIPTSTWQVATHA